MAPPPYHWLTVRRKPRLRPKNFLTTSTLTSTRCFQWRYIKLAAPVLTSRTKIIDQINFQNVANKSAWAFILLAINKNDLEFVSIRKGFRPSVQKGGNTLP